VSKRRGYVQAGPFVPEVVLEYPDALRELHREFLFAGAEVMVAMTYYAHRKNVPGYVAAQPVPYRTTTEQPTFMKLQEPE